MTYLTSDQENDVENIVSDLFQLYSPKPTYIQGDGISMYSFDKPSRHFWRGFVTGLMKKGATQKEIECILQSKNMRWMFDSDSDKVEEFGESMVSDSYIEWARLNMK